MIDCSHQELETWAEKKPAIWYFRCAACQKQIMISLPIAASILLVTLDNAFGRAWRDGSMIDRKE